MATPTLSPTLMPTKSNPFNTSSSDWAEIRVTLLLNAFMAVCLIGVAAFYGNLTSVYAPKPRRRTSAVRSGLRGFRDASSLDDEALGRAVGPDAQLLVRFLRAWRDICTIGGIVAAVILLPPVRKSNFLALLTPARWRGGMGLSPLDSVVDLPAGYRATPRAATASPASTPGPSRT